MDSTHNLHLVATNGSQVTNDGGQLTCEKGDLSADFDGETLTITTDGAPTTQKEEETMNPTQDPALEQQITSLEVEAAAKILQESTEAAIAKAAAKLSEDKERAAIESALVDAERSNSRLAIAAKLASQDAQQAHARAQQAEQESANAMQRVLNLTEAYEQRWPTAPQQPQA